MRKATIAELGLSWVYWLSTCIMLAASMGFLMLTTTGKGSDRQLGLAGSLVTLTFGLGSLAWPVLRCREKQGVATECVKTKDLHCEAIFIPGSRVKEYLTLVGSCTLAVGAAWLAIIAESHFDRVRAGLGAVCMGGAFFLCLKTYFIGRKGIILLPGGIIWREMFRAPYFIPWEVIEETALFEKKVPNNAKLVLTFGINVKHPALAQTTAWARGAMVRSKAEHGWHLFFFAETICVPLALVLVVVRLFHGQPELRREIGTPAGFARVRSLEAQLT